jgi:DNA polymerase-3 subunit delta
MEPASAGLKKVLEEIEAGEIKPVYLVSGDDEFLIREAINGIIDSLLPGKTRELNLQVFETEEDWQQIIQSLNTFGWLRARRVIVVKDSRIFVSKFNVENLVEKSLSQFEEGNREEGIRLYRIVL